MYALTVACSCSMRLRHPATPRSTAAVALARPPSGLPAVPESGLTRKRASRLLQAFFERRSDLTVRNYRIDLIHFSRWWRAGGHLVEETRSGKATASIDLESVAVPETIDARDTFVSAVLTEFYQLDSMEAVAAIISYQYDLKSGALGQVYAPKTINHRIAALRAVTGLARTLGLCQLDLSQIELVPTTLTRDTMGCGEDGVRKIGELLEEDFANAQDPAEKLRAMRDRLLVVLMYDLGLRRFESIQPRWPEDVDLRGGRLRFRGKQRPAKEWFEVLDEDTIVVIDEYLTVRGTEKGYLVYGRKIDRKLNERTVNKIVTKVSQRTNVHVTPHGFRHTATTVLLDKTDGNVRTVAAFLRHKGLGIVQDYDDARRGLAKKMSKLLSTSRRKA